MDLVWLVCLRPYCAPWDAICLTFLRFPVVGFAARRRNCAPRATTANSKGGRYSFPRSMPLCSAVQEKPHFLRHNKISFAYMFLSGICFAPQNEFHAFVKQNELHEVEVRKLLFV